MKQVMQWLAIMITLNACGQSSSNSVTKETWNELNDPSILGSNTLTGEYQYETKFDQLPLNADLPKTPWSDFYWPTYKGGLTYRWSQGGDDVKRYDYIIKPFKELTADEIRVLSPAEKYDLYMGFDDYRTTIAERERTGALRRIPEHDGYDAKLAPIPTWEGLCHAWAPATLAFDEPRAVTLKNKAGVEIPFASSDVNGLLTMFLHQVPSRSRLLGSRCNEDLKAIQTDIGMVKYVFEGSPYFGWTEEQKAAEIKKLEAELTRKGEQSECRDTNAGAFHLVITNQIALLKEGFVADVTRDGEVWNHGIYGYSAKIEEVKEGFSPDAALGTVKEVTVATTMKYIVEVPYHAERGAYNHNAAAASKDYRYRLELDRDGAIIGGKWLSYDRPDFLWKREIPKFEGIFTGVEEIYNAARQP